MPDSRHREWDLDFVLMDFGLALVQDFLIMLIPFPFGIEMCTLCHCVLEVCNLPVDFLGVTAKRFTLCLILLKATGSIKA